MAGTVLALLSIECAPLRSRARVPDATRRRPIMATKALTVTAALISVALIGARPSELAASRPAAHENVGASPRGAAYRNITVPAGTTLPLVLDSYVASDQSRVEDGVRAHVRRDVLVGGHVAIPAGTSLTGYVTSVQQSGRVKGRGRLAFRFTRLAVPTAEPLRISTSVVARQAPATKRKDATIIGLPAAGGAIIGAIAGGKKGAAIAAPRPGAPRRRHRRPVLSTLAVVKSRLGRGLPLWSESHCSPRPSRCGWPIRRRLTSLAQCLAGSAFAAFCPRDCALLASSGAVH